MASENVTGDYMANIPASRAGSVLDGGARTAPSIQIYVVKPSILGNINTNDSGSRVRLGAITGFTRTLTRNTQRRTELDSVIPGQTIEIMPLSISNFTITIKRAMLNESSMMEALGFSGIEDLMLANIPLLIEEVRYRRIIDGTGVDKYKQQIVRYNGCTIKSNPMNVDITGDWLIIQECEFDVAYCVIDEETDWSPKKAVNSGVIRGI